MPWMPLNNLADGTLHPRAGHRSLPSLLYRVTLVKCGMCCASSTLQVFSVRHFSFLSYVSGVLGGNGAAYHCGPSRKPAGHMGRVWLRGYGVDEG